MEVLDLDSIQSIDSYIQSYYLTNMLDLESFEKQWQCIQKTDECGGEKFDDAMEEKEDTSQKEVSVYEGAEGDEKVDEQDAVQEDVMIILKDIPDSFWSPWLDENTQSSQKVYKLKLNKISCEKCAKSFSRSWLKKHRCKPIRQTTHQQPAKRKIVL